VSPPRIAVVTPVYGNEATLELLAERLVELKVIDSIHPSTVCRTLQKS